MTVALFIAVSSCSIARGQLSAAQARELNQVYVRDSSIAIEKFALAERMQGLREWHKAADVYQEVLVNYADRVVPSQTNTNGQVIQYTSVVTSVQQQLARWPAEGLGAYRARYEVEAQSLLDSAKPGDLSTLHKVHSSYFVTDAGRIAGVRLVDAQLEAGEFAEGSMKPKIEALVGFVTASGGVGLLTSPERLAEGLVGTAGTRIVAA